jgi:hypothetical protein
LRTSPYISFPDIAFVHQYFAEMDKEKVPILTFLLMNCENAAELEEELAEICTKSFGEKPELFARDLVTRKDSRTLLELLLAGDMSSFNAGLAKLEDRNLAKKIETSLAEVVTGYKRKLSKRRA